MKELVPRSPIVPILEKDETSGRKEGRQKKNKVSFYRFLLE